MDGYSASYFQYQCQAQLAKAIERGDVWEAEYKKKCDEVDVSFVGSLMSRVS